MRQRRILVCVQVSALEEASHCGWAALCVMNLSMLALFLRSHKHRSKFGEGRVEVTCTWSNFVSVVSVWLRDRTWDQSNLEGLIPQLPPPSPLLQLRLQLTIYPLLNTYTSFKMFRNALRQSTRAIASSGRVAAVCTLIPSFTLINLIPNPFPLLNASSGSSISCLDWWNDGWWWLRAVDEAAGAVEARCHDFRWFSGKLTFFIGTDCRSQRRITTNSQLRICG